MNYALLRNMIFYSGVVRVAKMIFYSYSPVGWKLNYKFSFRNVHAIDIKCYKCGIMRRWACCRTDSNRARLETMPSCMWR